MIHSESKLTCGRNTMAKTNECGYFACAIEKVLSELSEALDMHAAKRKEYEAKVKEFENEVRPVLDATAAKYGFAVLRIHLGVLSGGETRQ